MKLPTLTQQPVEHIDCTPDSEYPLRILRAYLHNAECKWQLSGKASPEQRRVYALMNVHCDQRAAILKAAITILEQHAAGREV